MIRASTVYPPVTAEEIIYILPQNRAKGGNPAKLNINRAMIEAAIGEAKKWDKRVVVDFIGITDKLNRAKEILFYAPDYFSLHTAIDVQKTQGKSFKELAVFKKEFNIPLAIAGGITSEDIKEIIAYSPEIIVVGSFVTKAKDPYKAVMALRREIEHALS